MALNYPFPAAATAILATRAGAERGVARLLARARRFALPLLVLRMAPASTGGEAAYGAFLEALPGEVRLLDLAWTEAGGEVVVVLEGAASERAALDRLQRRALALGAGVRWRATRVREPTREALFEATRRRL